MKILLSLFLASLLFGNSAARADAATPPGTSISATDLALKLPDTD